MSEAFEDYLEAVLILSQQIAFIRSVDVASYLGVTKASVSHAVKILCGEGYMAFGPKKCLMLTDKGMEVAEKTYQRHTTLTSFFEKIGVPKAIAESDACRIEHILSEKTFESLTAFYQKVFGTEPEQAG